MWVMAHGHRRLVVVNILVRMQRGTPDMDAQSPDSRESAPPKKPYTAPALVTWGSLRDITQSVGWSGNSDGGKGKQPRRTR